LVHSWLSVWINWWFGSWHLSVSPLASRIAIGSSLS
jgi:hypothetical protein